MIAVPQFNSSNPWLNLATDNETEILVKVIKANILSLENKCVELNSFG